MLTQLILQELQDPNNRKIVNEGQPYFDIRCLDEGTLLFDDIPFAEIYIWDQFSIIRHCINLLPCFDERVKKRKRLGSQGKSLKISIAKLEQDLENFRFRPTKSPKYSHTADDDRKKYRKLEIAIKRNKDKLAKMIVGDSKTIRQALLQSGAMTLKELESEYKELIK